MTIVHCVTNLSSFCNQTSYLMTHFTMKKSNNIIPFGLMHLHIKKWSHRWNMETKPWQIPYPVENWKIRYMVVWIQNHDKFIVLIWKTLDMRFGCKIRINSLHSAQLSWYGKYRVNNINIELGFASPDLNFIDPIFFRIK